MAGPPGFLTPEREEKGGLDAAGAYTTKPAEESRAERRTTETIKSALNSGGAPINGTKMSTVIQRASKPMERRHPRMLALPLVDQTGCLETGPPWGTETMPTLVETKLEGRVFLIMLNRADRQNAVSVGLCEELVATFEEAERDNRVGAVMITSRGDAFCSGVDFEEAAVAGRERHAKAFDALFTLGTRYHKPLVAAVQGPVLSAGIGLVANAHVAVAAQGSTFGITGIRVGLWPFTMFDAVAAAVGERRAVELSLTGRIFSAPEALSYGLVHQIAPAFEFDDRAERIADQLAALSPSAMRQALHYLRRSRTLSTLERRELAREFHADALASDDFQEGVRALRERRAPEWPSETGSGAVGEH
jgi:enoyl-CoA hydratase/carnithine racemase